MDEMIHVLGWGGALLWEDGHAHATAAAAAASIAATRSTCRRPLLLVLCGDNGGRWWSAVGGVAKEYPSILGGERGHTQRCRLHSPQGHNKTWVRGTPPPRTGRTKRCLGWEGWRGRGQACGGQDPQQPFTTLPRFSTSPTPSVRPGVGKGLFLVPSASRLSTPSAPATTCVSSSSCPAL